MTHEATWRIEKVGVVESTNRIVFERALKGESEGLVVIADAQTHGRGRLGRPWFSPSGKNLYMSVLLRPDEAKRQLVSLACALAVSDALKVFGLETGLKWPNDVVVGDRKICGILCEFGSAGFVVAGIGVNLNARDTDFPDEIRSIATSFLIEKGVVLDRDDFAKRLLNFLELWYIKPHFDLLAEARARSITLGRKVRVVLANGEVEGFAEEMDETGAILVRSDVGLIRVEAGDVVHLR